jgi:hypothetical protein
MLCTTTPQPSDDDGSSECIVNGPTKAKPQDFQLASDLYEKTTNMGFGVFAKHDIKHGDLILPEHPLLARRSSSSSCSRMSNSLRLRLDA